MNLDLTVEADYLGNIEIESKYLQTCVIPWLIAQVKLIESDKRIRPVYLEANVHKNTLSIYKTAKTESNHTNCLFNHKLSDIFKLSCLPNDPLCFAYFYRKSNTSLNVYTLHVFGSNKTNLCQVIQDLQNQALKLHENLVFEKLFDFKLVTKLVITQEELNIPNFIELCLDKAVKINNNQIKNGLNKILKSKNEIFLNLLSDKRVLLKFGPNRLFIQESDQEPFEQEYKNVLYLNNSITNENFFCLAYLEKTSSTNLKQSPKNLVNALILYSSNVETIDDVIREYAINISSELNDNCKSREEKPSEQQHTCHLCPMQQFVELCQQLAHLESEHELIYDILIDKLNYNLDPSDQNYIFDCLSKINFTLDDFASQLQSQSAATNNNFQDDLNQNNLIESNQILVSLLHKLCQNKQNQHLIDYINNTKTSSSWNFNLVHLNNNKINMPQQQKQSKSVHSNLAQQSKAKKLQRSATLDFKELNKTDSATAPPPETSVYKFNRFLKNFKKSISDNNSIIKNANSSSPTSKKVESQLSRTSKRHIFNKIVGSPNGVATALEGKKDEKIKFKRFKSSYEIKQFWKKIISEQIILIKMEKENRKMSLKALYVMDKRLNPKPNLNYPEITPCLKEVDKIWDNWLGLEENSEGMPKLDEIRQTVFKGVPQIKREKIWFWLMKQYQSKNKEETLLKQNNSELRTNMDYRELLHQTTIHQHAILLDLGRTFPNHANFSRKYGKGQLALFNVLKAYSILDSEVGYCQGLSFIVGILLIHVNNDEEKAFDLLKFLLIDLNFREQYKPDMTQLQKHMYQFTRLLLDYCPDIYKHFDNNEISSSLYAAPWFLTLFSSQFQIGFVARVFDFLFIEGPIILFKLSLAILSIHNPLLQSCTSFETIVNHIKTTIPEMSLIESELIINKANGFTNIGDELSKYEVEFNLLYEDFSSFQNEPNENFAITSEYNSSKTTNEIEVENVRLKREVKDLKEKIQLLQHQVRNQDNQFYKLYNENKQLRCKVEAMELEKSSMLRKFKDQERPKNSISLK